MDKENNREVEAPRDWQTIISPKTEGTKGRACFIRVWEDWSSRGSPDDAEGQCYQPNGAEIGGIFYSLPLLLTKQNLKLEGMSEWCQSMGHGEGQRVDAGGENLLTPMLAFPPSTLYARNQQTSVKAQLVNILGLAR